MKSISISYIVENQALHTEKNLSSREAEMAQMSMLSEVEVWLSVDPLAEKYPGWSPYNYTLLNPVKLVDPDGRVPLSFRPPIKKILSTKLSGNSSNIVLTTYFIVQDDLGALGQIVSPEFTYSVGVSKSTINFKYYDKNGNPTKDHKTYSSLTVTSSTVKTHLKITSGETAKEATKRTSIQETNFGNKQLSEINNFWETNAVSDNYKYEESILLDNVDPKLKNIAGKPLSIG